MKHQGPASYGSNPDINEVPHTSGPQSVGGMSLQFLSQPNFQKPGPIGMGYSNQNNRALSEVNGPFQPYHSTPTPTRPHYDYDSISVLSKDQNDWNYILNNHIIIDLLMTIGGLYTEGDRDKVNELFVTSEILGLSLRDLSTSEYPT